MAADVIGDESETTRDDYEASEDDNVLVQGVAGTEGATGYFGYTYYEENADCLKALAIDGGNGCVEPSAETAQSRRVHTALPSAVHLRQQQASYNDNAAVKEYTDFYIENLEAIAEAALFIPLNEEQYAETQSALEASRAEREIPQSHESAPTAVQARPPGRACPLLDLRVSRARRGRDQGRRCSSALLSVAITVGIVSR